ncbi:hypothetical protein BC827DRAFT_1273927 [Russula dissimulans]|nr:hypothetical protein BC827DRAFT_1273927 [Russula dissimulans]
MIDKSVPFNDSPPPPYQHTVGSSAAANAKVNPEPTSTSRSSSQTTLSKRHPKTRTKATTSSRWFPTSIFGLSKTAKQVRTATQGFIRDLLSQARPNEHEWHSVLGNCAETCSRQGLSFSSILQEPFVEGHLPIYWAILKRPPQPVKADHATPAGDPDALVLAILDSSLPLSPQSVADARLACMTVSDNALFVRLGQRYEAFLPRSGTDRVLLGGADTVDIVSVEETRGNGDGGAAAAAFTVRFSITQFQLRMRVSKLARIEFIARGRLWYLAFSVGGVPTGPHLQGRTGDWLVSLGLGECSAPAWVDARLSIVDGSSPPEPQDSSSVAYRMARRSLPIAPKHPNSGKHRPPASLPIKTGSYQIAPGGPIREIVVSLDKVLFGTALQNDASSYVDNQGSLNGELVVKLQKTQELDTNCVIC